LFLLMVSYALLDDVTLHGHNVNSQAENEHSPELVRSALRFWWLAVVLLLGAASWLAQRAASGEDARIASDQFARTGAATMALQSAREATAVRSIIFFAANVAGGCTANQRRRCRTGIAPRYRVKSAKRGTVAASGKTQGQRGASCCFVGSCRGKCASTDLDQIRHVPNGCCGAMPTMLVHGAIWKSSSVNVMNHTDAILPSATLLTSTLRVLPLCLPSVPRRMVIRNEYSI
jgi:hypothetical protein